MYGESEKKFDPWSSADRSPDSRLGGSDNEFFEIDFYLCSFKEHFQV
jgi:hypothetical protein